MGGNIQSLDPFSHMGSMTGASRQGNYVARPSAAPPAATATATSTTTTATVSPTSAAVATSMISTSSPIPPYTTPVALESQYLVSSDQHASAVYQFARRLSTLEHLTTTEQAALAALPDCIVKKISPEQQLPIGSLQMLGRVAAHPDSVLRKKSQMAALFLLRLAVLRLRDSADVETHLHNAETLGFLDALQAEGGIRDGFFSGPPALVMALCCSANMLSVSASREWLLQSGRGEALLNASLSMLGHTRQEVRSMAATLGYNLALALNQATGWSPESEDPSAVEGAEVEVPPQAVQLLCGALEELDTEADTLVRQRRLRLALYVIRSCGAPAVQLASDLGFVDVLVAVYRRSDVHPNETQLLCEMNHRLSNSGVA